MSDNRILSQEEINALLNGTGSEDAAAAEEDYSDLLSPIEKDALGEIGNISLGNAATSLAILLGQDVDITTPSIEVLHSSELVPRFPRPHVSINVDYTDGFQGMNLLVLKEDDAKVIANLMMGGNGEITEEELSELHISAVQEAMNQMMGSAATSMSTLFNRFVNITPPAIQILDMAKDGTPIFSEDIIVGISFRLTIGTFVDSNIMQLVPLSFAKGMVEMLMGGGMQDAAVSQEEPAPYSTPAEPVTSVPEPQVQAKVIAPEQQVPAQPKQPSSPPPTAAFSFPSFTEEKPVTYNDLNLNLLMDIPLSVSVELGRASKRVDEILELSDGSIVELDKLSGEPVDILVNNKLIAKGEVVVIDENFAVRLTEIIQPNERIRIAR